MTQAHHSAPFKMTAEQYLQLGEDPPGVRLELVDGEILVSPSPTVEHAYVLSQLFGILRAHIVAHKLGLIMSDTDHRLTLYDVRRPDLYYFPTDRIHLLGDGPIKHPPELAIEVISPGSEKTDRIKKSAAYAEFGIPNYWIADPKGRSLKAFKLRRRKYVAAGSGSRDAEISFSPFDDLTINLGELWWPPK